MKKLILAIFILWISVVWAKPIVEPLSADEAFSLKVYLDSRNQIVAEWTMAPGYYLYRDKIHFSWKPTKALLASDIILPKGKKRQDKIHGTYEAYTGKMEIRIPLAETVDLTIHYQGCADSGICYPPMTKRFKMGAPDSSQDYATQVLVGHKLVVVLFIFLGLGLLLAFTPCVLPMVPILSGIIVGYHRRETLTTARAFLLSLFYVLGMAFTYMVLGIVVAMAGSQVQIVMQNPWVIVLFGGFFILLAFSLLGFYELHLPKSWQMRLMKWDERFKRGTYLGVFLMGCFSSLIVSPCVSAPLVGVLAYIAQTGNVVLGASALLALGIGMGIPLLLVGASAGKFLPKSGPWMVFIQKMFGVIMLGVAIWFFSRIIPDTAPVFFHSSKNQQVSFTVLKNMSQLDQALALAKQERKPVILDFYAHWCTTCKIIDASILANDEVEKALKNVVFLRADVTQNTAFDQAILKRFNAIAPPTFLFFDTSGKELTSERLIGEFSKKQLMRRLKANN